MTSLDLLINSGTPYLHICLLVAFLVFSFSHIKLLFVPISAKKLDDECTLDYESEDTSSVSEPEETNTEETNSSDNSYPNSDIQHTDVTPPSPSSGKCAPAALCSKSKVAPVPVSAPSRKKNKKNKRKKAKATPPPPPPPVKFESSSDNDSDDSCVGPSFSDSDKTIPGSPVFLPVVSALPEIALGSDAHSTSISTAVQTSARSISVVPILQSNVETVTPVIEPTSVITVLAPKQKKQRVNRKSALLKRIAAQLRLRIKNKSLGMQIDYSSFALLPSTVNVPYGCKVAETDSVKCPFEQPSVSPSHSVVGKSIFDNDMSLPMTPFSQSSLTALAPEFVPTVPEKSKPAPMHTIRTVQPLQPIRQPPFDMPHSKYEISPSFDITPAQPLLAAAPAPQPRDPVDLEAMLSAQLEDNQLDNVPEADDSGGIRECIPVLCKFGNSCSRSGCHFMHSMRPSVIRRCKYDNLCIRSDCHFSHPNGRPLLQSKRVRRPIADNKTNTRNTNSLGLPPAELASRVMSLAALGYNVTTLSSGGPPASTRQMCC